MEFNPAKLNPPQPDEPQASTREWPKRKRWKVAKRTTMGKYNAIRNMLIEDHFMRVRKAVRLLYAQHSEYFYDNNQREDLSESTVSMHSLACDTFYMILDCNYCDEYVVEYDIESSPFKEEITILISKGPMYSIAKQIMHEPSMAAHFQYMRSYHKDNPEHFSYLNVEIEQQD